MKPIIVTSDAIQTPFIFCEGDDCVTAVIPKWRALTVAHTVGLTGAAVLHHADHGEKFAAWHFGEGIAPDLIRADKSRVFPMHDAPVCRAGEWRLDYFRDFPAAMGRGTFMDSVVSIF